MEKTTTHFSQQLSFHRKLPSFERALARARANHAKIDAQKGCAMQLNGIILILSQKHALDYPPVVPAGVIVLKC